MNEETHTTTFDRLNYGGVVPSAENRIRIFRGTTRRIETLNLPYRPTIKDEVVVRSAATPTYRLARVPVVPVDAVNRIRVSKADGMQVTYGPGSMLYNSANPPAPSEVNITTSDGTLTFGQVPTAQDTMIATYAADHAPPTPGQVLVTTWDGTLTFATGEAASAANGDRLVASYLVDRERCVLLALSYDVTREAYIVPDGRLLGQLVDSASTLVDGTVEDAHGADKPKDAISAYFGTGSNTPGNNGADAGRDEYAAGLNSLANQLINIVLLAGQDVGQMGAVLEAHLNTTA